MSFDEIRRNKNLILKRCRKNFFSFLFDLRAIYRFQLSFTQVKRNSLKVELHKTSQNKRRPFNCKNQYFRFVLQSEFYKILFEWVTSLFLTSNIIFYWKMSSLKMKSNFKKTHWFWNFIDKWTKTIEIDEMKINDDDKKNVSSLIFALWR